MTCSRNFGRVLQAGCLGLIGALTVVGCGGSESKPTPDASVGIDGAAGSTGKAILNATPPTVNLGTVDVGKASTPVNVTITNTGTAASTVTVNPSGVGVSASGCSGSLAIGGSCIVAISATPTAPGSIVGSVAVIPANGSPLSISVTGAAVQPGSFTVAPTSIPLGQVAVGATIPVSVTVTATANITGLTTTVQGPDLTLATTGSTCTGTLAAGASCVVAATFTATAAGSPTNDAIVVSQGDVPRVVPVTATVVTPAKVSATPLNPALTAVPGQASVNLDVNVGNSGGLSTGVLGVVLAGTNASDFKVVDDKCSIVTLAPGAFCIVTVAYTPAATVTAVESATLTIVDKNAGGSSVVVTLSGTPNISGLSVAGGPALGSVAPGVAGAEVLFTVTSSSATPTGLLTPTVTSPLVTISSNTCAALATLNKGEACTIGLKLTPPAGTAAQAVSGLLTVAAAAGGTASASFTGSVLTPAGLSASPTSVNFGSVFLNQSSAVTTVTITNNGATSSGSLTVTRSGTGTAQVAVTGDTCTGASLAALKTCTISVQYSPQDNTGVNGTITVTDGTASVAVPMVGSGLTPTNIIVCSGSEHSGGSCPVATFGDIADTHDFKSMVVGSATAANRLTVLAPSSATTDTGAITATLSGTNAADFTVTSNCTVSLVPGASCGLDVIFKPSDVGTRTAVLTVTGAKGGTWPVQLSGVGQAIVSIYACSTKAPANPTTDLSDEGCAHLSQDAADLDFGQVALNSATPVVKSFRIVVRGPLTAATAATATTITAALNDLSTTGSNFSYPNALDHNPCTGAALMPGVATHPDEVAPNSGNTWSWVTSSTSGDAGYMCNFQVQFFPQGTVKEQKTATLTASGSAGGSDTRTITGTATGPLTITKDAESLGFPASVMLGSSTNNSSGGANTNLTLDVTNTSTTATLGPLSVALTGDQFQVVSDNCTGSKLAPSSAPCLLVIAFTPTATAPATGSITVSGSGEQAVYALSANVGQQFKVTITPAGTAVAPASVGAAVVEGNSGDWVMFTIANPVGAPTTNQFTYELTEGATTGASTAHFKVDGAHGTDNPCGASGLKALDGGGSCHVWVQYTPLSSDSLTASDDGTNPALAQLVVNVNSGTVSSYISGTPASKLTVTSTQAKSTVAGLTDAYDFGDVAVGADSGLVTFTVANLSPAQVTVSQPAAGATDPFSIVTGGTCAPTGTSFTVAANGSCTVLVKMTGRTTVGPTDPAYQEEPAVSMTFQEVGQSSFATAKLTGRTVHPAALQVVGLPASGTVPAIDLGTIVNPNPTAPVTLAFKNTGDVPATSLKFQWAPGGSVTCSGAATDKACDPFVVLSESGSRTSCYGLASLGPQQVCYLSIAAQPSNSVAEVEGATKPIALSATTPTGAISVQTVLTVKSTIRVASNTSTEVYFEYSNKSQFGFLPFTALASGTVAVGKSSTQVIVTIENKSGSTVALPNGDTTTWANALGGSTDFTVVSAGTNPCPATTLAANSSCTIGVTFNPTTYSATTAFKFASLNLGAFGTNSANTLGLVGEVTAPAKLTLSPASLAFGDVLINSSSALSLTVTNTGATDATAVSATVNNTGVFAVSGCGATIAAGTNCVLTVTAVPTAASQTGTLSISYTGGDDGVETNSPITAALTVNGVTSANLALSGVAPTVLAVVDANTQSLDLGAGLVIGAGTTETAEIQIANGNTAKSGTLGITLTGNTDSFTLDKNNCADVDGNLIALDGGVSCSVIVTFKPASAAGTTVPGAMATALTVTANPGIATTKTVNITGHALPAISFFTAADRATALTSPVAVLTSGPSSIYVGLVSPVTATSAPFSTVTLSGDDASSFYLSENGCLYNQISSTGTCLVKVIYVGGTSTTAKKTTLTVSDGTTGYTNAIGVQYTP